MNREPKLPFRLALLSYVVVSVAVVAEVLIIGHGDLPEPAALYIEWWARQTQSDLEWFAGWLGLIGVLVSVLAAIAMTFFRRWARPVYAVGIAILVVSEGLLDLPVLKTPLEYVLDTVLAVLAGSIIASSYSLPISKFFHPPET